MVFRILSLRGGVFKNNFEWALNFLKFQVCGSGVMSCAICGCDVVAVFLFDGFGILGLLLEAMTFQKFKCCFCKRIGSSSIFIAEEPCQDSKPSEFWGNAWSGQIEQESTLKHQVHELGNFMKASEINRPDL